MRADITKEEVVASVRNQLTEAGSETRRMSSDRFFKENERAMVYGVKMADVGTIGKETLKQIAPIGKEELFDLCESLWQSPYLEENIIACLWAESKLKEFTCDDFDTFDRWVNNYVTNWATCDTLCNHTVGGLLMKYPELIERLEAWSGSINRWTRRASAVSLIIPARKGMFLPVILRIAECLLTDSDHMVQKGYGWMLKAASEAHAQEVFGYVVSKKKTMPRTAYRYALEKMPPEWKKEAMKKEK